MLKIRWAGLLAVLLLAAGCATDPWKDVPPFEVSDFICPVPGGKFLEDAHYVSAWSLLGPLKPGKEGSLHEECLPDEALLNGNRRAPRGVRWCRVRVKTDDGEPGTLSPGQVDFSERFLRDPRAQGKSVFYACVTLKCERDHAGLILHAGSCGQIKIWINGRAVYSCEKGHDDLKPEMATVGEISLHRGYNRIVVKYLDDGKDYREKRRFFLRFTDAAGNLSQVRG